MADRRGAVEGAGEVDALVHDEGDGTYSKAVGAHLRVWNGAAWVRWDGSLSVGSLTVGKVDQGAAGASAWPVSLASVPSHAVTNAGVFAVQASWAAAQHVIVDSGTLGSVTINGVPHVVIDSATLGTLTTNATLSAETSKVIGTVNQGTSPWVTNATLAAETSKVIGTVNQGTSPWVVGAHAVTNAGTFAVQQTRPATGATSSPASVTTSVATVLASNAARYGATVYNESGAICYLKLGSAASLTDYTLQVAIGGYYEAPFAYTGVLTGITSSGTAVLRVTEISA